MEKYSLVIVRLLMGHIFLLAGISKIGQYTGTQGYMESVGVPGMLLPLVILLEIGGGVALIVGFKVKIIAWTLAGFSLVAAVMFHANFADQMQMIMFMKNFAIAGGLILFANYGAGPLSLDDKFASSTSNNTVGANM